MRPGSARLTVLSVMVVAAIAAPVAAQTLYRWVDENGVVHYSQFPPPAPTAPPSPAPEGKPAAPPEAKPSPPGAKPSLPPEAKPAPAGGGEARAGSRGQALATTKAEPVARGVAHSRARAGDPRAGAHGNGLRPHRRHAPADRPGSGPGPEAGARAPAAPTRLARGGAEADRRGPPDVRRCLPHRAVRG